MAITVLVSHDDIMTEPDLPTSSTVYQLRAVLRGISPLIWRRLLVHGDASLADLHAALQVAFAWDGSHLHRFVVHGTEYGICYYGGPVFRDDPTKVSLVDLGLRVGERFRYDYDFTDDWHHDIRVEQVMAADPNGRYPRCTGGRRSGPPEDCGGPWAFEEGRQRYGIFFMASLLADMMEHPDARLGDYSEQLSELRPWFDLDRFDRRATNRTLAQLCDPERSVA